MSHVIEVSLIEKFNLKITENYPIEQNKVAAFFVRRDKWGRRVTRIHVVSKERAALIAKLIVQYNFTVIPYEINSGWKAVR